MVVSGLLKRVRALEERRAAALRLIEYWNEFEAEARAGIETGRYDPDDLPVVLQCVRKWINDGVAR